MIPNAHKNPEMVIIKKYLEINCTKLCLYINVWRASFFYPDIFIRPNPPQKHCKGLTQWESVPLGMTIIYTTANLPTLATKKG